MYLVLPALYEAQNETLFSKQQKFWEKGETKFRYTKYELDNVLATG